MDYNFYDIFRIGYIKKVETFMGLGSSLLNEFRFGMFVAAVVAYILFGFFCFLILNSKQSFYSLVMLYSVFSGGRSNFYDRIANTQQL